MAYPPVSRRTALGLLLTGALGLEARSANASLARAVSLSELVRGSRLVVAATPLEATSRWEDADGRKRIVTDTRVRMDELYGGSSEGSEFFVRTLGGVVGKIGQVVHGEAVLLIGEPALLFVTPSDDGPLVVTAMAQGHYPIRSDASGVRRVHSSPRLATLLSPDGSAVRALVGKSIDEARDIVRKAWRDAR